MKLIGIIYLIGLLLSFYGRLGAASVNVTPKLNTFMKRIIRSASWNQSNTEFNPDVILDTPQMIRRAGYPVEAHVIMTDDGYLLTLHRIPGGNDSLPVLLQHGLLSSSVDWIILGKDKAIDQGYDVWLGNFRGNTYSRAHISLSPSNSTFWNFSFNKMGIYDLPAMITFITNMRSQPLHTYIGHSMGITSFFIMASERPKIARMVQMMICFAPGVFLNHIQSPIQYLIPFKRNFEMVMRLSYHDEFLPNDLVRFLLKNICDQNITGEFCINVLFMIYGDDPEQFNYNLQLVIYSHLGSISTKTIIHFVQEVESGKFCKYDYGREENLLIYNSVEPPDYDLSNITIPIALFYANNDWLVNKKNVKKLYHLLPNVIDMYEVPWPKFNHADFVWAKNAPKLVYDRVFKIMRGESLNNVT
ncbi:Lipase 3 [Camponotus floridanus]|uniref:Lipase n=1 Tax=Camponotus floridanus TaxID=104421 RepID=E2B1U7_CAMFO|nr:Lipase 3 [Camponotus floridanus]